MIYYRVKPEKDNVPKRKKGSFAQDGIYIPSRNGASIARHIYTHRTRKHKPKETYWCFGARFQNKEG